MHAAFSSVLCCFAAIFSALGGSADAAPPPPFQVESFQILTGTALPNGALQSKVNDAGQFIHLLNLDGGGQAYRTGSSTLGPSLAADPFAFAITRSGQIFGNRFSTNSSTGTSSVGVTTFVGSSTSSFDPARRHFSASDTFGNTVYAATPNIPGTGMAIDIAFANGVKRRFLDDPRVRPTLIADRDDRGKTYFDLVQVNFDDPPPTELLIVNTPTFNEFKTSYLDLSPIGPAGIKDVAPNGNIALTSSNGPGGTHRGHAFIQGEWFTLAPTTGLPESEALGVTSVGVVIGNDYTNGDSTPWLWFRGTTIRLDTLLGVQLPAGVTLRTATGVSDTGWIVGELIQDGVRRTYRLKINIDSDADGMPDIWEMPVEQGGGVYVDADNIVDIDLHAMGATPDHKDLFVEIDSSPNTMMSAAAADLVTKAFAKAPIDNIDGVRGIRLHIIRDEAITSGLMPPTGLAAAAGLSAAFPVEAASVTEGHFGTLQMRSKPNWALVRPAWEQIARYCLAFHDIVRSDKVDVRPYVGLAELGGDQFVYSFKGAETLTGSSLTEKVAAAFMHELGHTLGLDHGGQDPIKYKPNYLSIMNYLLVTPRPFSKYFYRLDFSRAQARSQSEEAPNENNGFAPDPNDPDASVYARYRMPYIDDTGTIKFAKRGMAPIDLNGNGSIEFFLPPRELNAFPNSAAFPSGLNSPSLPLFAEPMPAWDDWANVRLRIDRNGVFSALSIPDHTGYDPDSLNAIDGFAEGCGADFNDDDLVDDADFVVFIGAYNLLDCADPAMPAACPTDLNLDDFVDDADFVIFLAAYNSLLCPS
ncbi:MAG: hypothetical protein JNK16_11350 [Phycisphaerales bacterium]|nr:hypothetical protein [Phycisphaerales bacterium]